MYESESLPSLETGGRPNVAGAWAPIGMQRYLMARTESHARM